jgi:hypothetical protein
MKTLLDPINKNIPMKTLLNPMLRLLATVAVPFLLWTATASAQFFYVTTGTSGVVNKVSSTGTLLPDLISYGPGAHVQGIAAATNGDIYVSVLKSGTATVNQVTPGGVSTVFATLPDQVLSLAFNSTGDLYGVSAAGGPSGGHDIGIITGGGFSAISITGAPFAPLFSAQDLAFDNIGNLFVSNNAAGGVYANSVVKLAPSIATPGSWDSSQFADTAGFNAFGLAIDGSGNVFVSSTVVSSATPIRKYLSDGTLTAFNVSGGNFLSARGLELANGSLYEADFSFNLLNEIDPTTGVATNFVSGLGVQATYIAYSPVPEPSQVALIVLGGMVLMGTMRRNRQPRTC